MRRGSGAGIQRRCRGALWNHAYPGVSRYALDPRLIAEAAPRLLRAPSLEFVSPAGGEEERRQITQHAVRVGAIVGGDDDVGDAIDTRGIGRHQLADEVQLAASGIGAIELRRELRFAIDE